MAAVQALANAVHHPAVSGIRKGLHQNEGHGDNQHAAHECQR